MKLKIILFSILPLNFIVSVNSSEVDCNQFKKFSAKYVECNANKLKKKATEKIDVGKDKFEKSNFKDKLKKFKSSKTLSDVIKKQLCHMKVK